MRGSTAALATRIMLAISRGTLTRVNDAPKLQTADIRLLHDEQIAGAERFQDYGFTSVPKSADGSGTAEVVTIFVAGNRSHPIVICVDDRRYRIKGLQPGESTQYDDQGQQVYISRSGIQILGGPSNLPVTVKVGNATFVVGNGTITGTDKAGSTYELDGAGNIQLTPQGGNVMVNGNLVVTQSINVENQSGVPKPFQVTGNINLTGTLAATGDVTAGLISLQNHTHPAPGGETGAPTG